MGILSHDALVVVFALLCCKYLNIACTMAVMRLLGYQRAEMRPEIAKMLSRDPLLLRVIAYSRGDSKTASPELPPTATDVPDG